MKMNLSVVMGMVDKVSAPLKGLSGESNRYTKAIKKVQAAQANDAAAIGMIDSFKQTKKAMDKNALAIAATNEKLQELKAKASAAGKPSAALTEKIFKQKERLDKLNITQDSYKRDLGKLDSQLKKTGLNTDKLDSEYARLNKRYKTQSNEISKLSKRYAKLQTAMKPVQKLSRMLKMPRLGGAVMGKGAALLGGLSLTGLVTEINSTAAEMDKLSKTAKTLTLPISELQAMQSQANHAGVESDALSGSMLRFTKRLGVLQETGSGALGSFLKKSGNSLHKDLQGANSTQEAYEMLLSSFSKLKTTQEQMAFADAAFGQDGRKMLIMLREGTEGLSSARKELSELGGGATDEDAEKAEAYNDALQKVQESFRSIKFAALAPVMEKLTKLFDKFSNKFKNVKWRTDLIEKVKKAVDKLYRGISSLGKGLLWISKNFKGLITIVALLKVGVIALNMAMMSSPIGLIVAGIAAAAIAITYLIDRFVGLDKVLKWIENGIGMLWDSLKRLINMLPDSLIPDGWKIQTEQASKEVDKLASKLDGIKDKNAKLGITTYETHTQRSRKARPYHLYPTHGLRSRPSSSPYQPLTKQSVSSKSEVSLTIKSDKPVTVDKAKSEKGTDLNLDVGELGVSY